jgi:hypothetical protein
MARRRNVWIGLVAAGAVAALAGTGWLMVRSRQGAPDRLDPIPVAPRAVGTGSAKLSWDRIDPQAYGIEGRNDPVAGFRVYAGPAPDRLRLEATIENPRATGFVVRNLPRGTWYYTVTTYPTLGIESERPPPVAKTIR